MYSVENHIDISEIRGGKGNPVISFQIDNDKNNYSIQELLNAISALSSRVGCTAEEAGNAFRELSNAMLTDYNPDIDNTLEHTALQMLQHAKGFDLDRPETRGQTAIPNENEPFDFLEQNVYDTDLLLNFPEDDGNQFITPLDSY